MGLGALTPLFLQTGNAPLAESNAFYQHQLQSAEAQAEQQRAAQTAEQTQEAQATAPLIQQQEQLKLQQAQQQLASQKTLQATMQNLYGSGQQPGRGTNANNASSSASAIYPGIPTPTTPQRRADRRPGYPWIVRGGPVRLPLPGLPSKQPNRVTTLTLLCVRRYSTA